MLTLHSITTVLLFAAIVYIVTAIAKAIFYTRRIYHGRSLSRKLFKFSDDFLKVSQLYGEINEYCKAVGVKALSDPYGVPSENINKSNAQVQMRLQNSLNEAVGINLYRRHYCYILFTIHPDDKARSVCKAILDALIKLAVSVCCGLITDMLG